MTDDRNEDTVDRMLIEGARDYNAPASIPREEMWSRIQAARSASRQIGSPRRLWVWPSVGIAAAVLLTVGVVIGRKWERADVGPPTTVASKAPVREAPEAPSLSYQLVVLKHLAGSEAMITAFRSAAKRGELDAEMRDRSQELLSTTRMLEASNVSDPTMRRLLEDLDLVLAQIKQYVARGTNNPDDLDLIEQSIAKRGVMTKLRGTIPARSIPAGT